MKGHRFSMHSLLFLPVFQLAGGSFAQGGEAGQDKNVWKIGSPRKSHEESSFHNRIYPFS